MRESFSSTPSLVSESERLSHLFREIGVGGDEHVFEELEGDLHLAGFTLGKTQDVFAVMQRPQLLCRSESFSRVLDLLLIQKDIVLENQDEEANMCRMSSGAGFRVAMLEGFSGKEVGGIVKVVITFEGGHLVTQNHVKSDSRLWETKPETAQVSLVGKGKVLFEDIRMISFRFPIRFFPQSLLSQDEQERLEENQIFFVVRHYIAE